MLQEMPVPARSNQTGRLLIVQHDPTVRAALRKAGQDWGFDVAMAATCDQAMRSLEEGPSLVILDCHLPDGDPVRIVQRAADLSLVPAIVGLSSMKDAAQIFRLARSGVKEIVETPADLAHLKAIVFRALSEPRELVSGSAFGQLVGCFALREAKDAVRQQMIEAALARTEGNQSAAARLLGVTRQAIQKFVRDKRGTPAA
jgi:DNA-binding NtrC family response regulator